MYNISKKKNISDKFSIEDVFKIITDVEKYKDFVPFCSNVALIENKLLSDNYFIADLSLEVLGVKYTYRSKTSIEKLSDKAIICTTGDSKGVLKYLKSNWVITKNTDETTIIEYDVCLDLNINIPFLPIEKILRSVADKIVESFEKRLRSLNI